MHLLGIDHVQIAMPAGREAEARAFYGGVLKLEEIAKPAALADRGGCWFGMGPIQIHLGIEPDFRPARKAHPAFLVEDLPAWATRLARAGCPVSEDVPLPGCRRLFVADPFGNRIELLERAER